MTAGPAPDLVGHWEGVYRERSATTVSWYQERPETSLRLLAPYASSDGAVVDVGAGASQLTDGLLDQGWGHVSSLDVSARALAPAQARLRRQERAHFIISDLLTWNPDRSYDSWHDRAVFHFLTGPGERDRYVALATGALKAGGHMILATFSPRGPQSCSGLPVARYDAAQLADVFDDHFELLHSERETHLTPQGSAQEFTWVDLRRT